MEGKTVLVTGAGGFIGQHLLQRLQEIPDIKLLALTRQFVNESAKSGVIQWLEGSLDNLTTTFWINHGIKHVDIIFHLGGFTPKVAKDANNLHLIYKNNIVGSQKLLDNLPNVPTRIVFASTLDVYEGNADPNVIIDETTSLIPSGLYGASKLFCEQMVMEYASQQGCGFAILRYGHIYGPGEMAYRKFIPEIIRKLIANESPIIYGDGSTLRDFLYVDDVVEATLRAAVHSSNALGPVNIVRGQSVPLHQIVDHLLTYTGRKVQPIYMQDKPNGLSLQFNNNLMMSLLEKWEFTSLWKGLEAQYDQFKQQV